VKNNDIFNLPGSDWQLLTALTLIASVVRLFRIAQPSSVVFDEVQYVRSTQAYTHDTG
jgi:dolichyl-phosphate-mannose-protein mannosyltransferase